MLWGFVMKKEERTKQNIATKMKENYHLIQLYAVALGFLIIQTKGLRQNYETQPQTKTT